MSIFAFLKRRKKENVVTHSEDIVSPSHSVNIETHYSGVDYYNYPTGIDLEIQQIQAEYQRKMLEIQMEQERIRYKINSLSQRETTFGERMYSSNTGEGILAQINRTPWHYYNKITKYNRIKAKIMRITNE